MFVKIKVFGKLAEGEPHEIYFILNTEQLASFYVEEHRVVVNAGEDVRVYAFDNQDSAISFACALTEIVTGGTTCRKGGFYKIETMSVNSFAV